MANEVLLQEGHPVDENLRPLKVGGKATSIETAQHGNGCRISGDLEVTGNIRGNIKDVVHDLTSIVSTDLTIVDSGDITFDAEGDIKLDAQGGNITLLDGGSTYTPSATSDATTKTYVDTKYFFSQTMNYYSPLTDHDAEWLLINNESFFKLGGTDTTVTDTETTTINAINQTIARSLWFVAPYNMTITHISGSVMDDDIDSHPAGNYRLGIWTVASFGASGSTPAAKTGSQTFTLDYITVTVSGTEDDDTAYVFYDTSPSLTLTAGDGVWVGYLNTRSALGDAATVSMSIWGYAT
mgnify:CR=1 FL=1